MAEEGTNAREGPWGQCWPIANHPPNARTLFVGASGIIYTVPDRPNEVVKVPQPFDDAKRDHEIERRVYRRLGKHRNLVNVVEMDEYGIYLERASYGCLRLYFKEGGIATLQERIKWSRDTTRVLHHVHQNNVRHADLSGRNLLIDSERDILLCDFSGSSIDGEKATIRAECGFRHPNESEYMQPTMRAEIYSLGSTIYEIVTGTKPYQGLEDHVINKLVEARQYPDITKIPLGDVIIKCWKGGFDSAAEVAKEITRSCPEFLDKN